MKKNQNLILEVLKDGGGHLTAEEIFIHAKTRGEKISQATVYNNLSEMAKNGDIKRISLSTDGGTDRYDITCAPHGHLVCKKCHALSDFFAPEIGEIIAEKTGIRTKNYDLSVYYVCNGCQAE